VTWTETTMPSASKT